MKRFLLALAVLVGAQSFAATPDPASTFIDKTLAEAKQILSLKDQSDRNNQLCTLLRDRLGYKDISQRWLGTYFTLARDQAARDEFTGMVPSIMMTKALPILGAGGVNGAFEVAPTAKDRGNGISEVQVTVKSNGKSYVGFAIVQTIPNLNRLELVDVEYQGFSAVDYTGREYQKFLTREFNKDPNNSMPISALVENIKTAEDYVACP